MKISRATNLIFQNHAKKQIDPSLSLNDMVDNIIRKDNFYEGSSHLIIDKIVNSTAAERREAWAKSDIASKKAKYKIDKYFNEGLKVDNVPSKNKNVKINFSDKGAMLQPIDVKDKEISSAKNECERPNFSGKIREGFKQAANKMTGNIEWKIESKKNKRAEDSEKINKVEYDNFDDLINDFKKGNALSENGLSHIKFLMSYIRIREPIDREDNIRKELENVFVKITNSLTNIDDKNKVLQLYREERFLSIYNSSCRVATCAIESLLEKKGFNKEIITKIKEYLINYSREYLVKLKLNEPKYDDYIKNIKKFSDFEVFKGVESVEKIILLKGILSENKFTSEERRFLTELSHNLKDERIIDFIKEKINLDIGFLQSEYDGKCVEEKKACNEYIKEKNKIIDISINRIKSMLIMRKIPESIADSVIEVINKEGSNIEIDLFSSKVDLIINILQCKEIKGNKITNDIKHYLNISMDQLKREFEIAKSKKILFQGRISSLFNELNNRVLNFIYKVRYSFK